MIYYHIMQPDGSISLGKKNNDDIKFEKIVKGNTTIIKTQSGLVMKLKPYVPTPIDVDLSSDDDSDYDSDY